MKLHLQELIKKSEKGHTNLILTERLPEHLHSPCKISVQYQIEKRSDYYLLSLETEAKLLTTCQRCLEEETIPYHNKTQLAVCHDDARAEVLSNEYECVVASDDILDLGEIITDELYLYSLSQHLDSKICDERVARYFE